MDGNTDRKEVSNRKAANRLKKFINSINHIGKKKAGGEEGQLHIRKNVLLQPKADKKHLHLQPRGDWHKLRCALYGGSKEKACQTHKPAGTLVLHKVLSSGSSSVSTQEGVYGQPPKEVPFPMAY